MRLVFMDNGGKLPVYFNGNAKLFHDFPRKGVLWGFVGVYFPAGQFPETRMLPRSGPFSKKNFSIIFYNSAHDFKVFFFHNKIREILLNR